MNSVYLAHQLDQHRDQRQHKRIRESRLLAIERVPIGEHTKGQIIEQVTYEIVIGAATSAGHDLGYRGPNVISIAHQQRRRNDGKRCAEQCERHDFWRSQRTRTRDRRRNRTLYAHQANCASIQRARTRCLTLELALGQRLQR